MNIRETIIDLGKKAKIASQEMRLMKNKEKNLALENLIKNINLNSEQIITANDKDVELALKKNLSSPLINRLKISSNNIKNLTKSINEIITQPDPIGITLEKWSQPNGLKFKKITIPLGVLGVIYESRPNVTVDASCISLKSGNSIILRGGSDSFNTSQILVKIISNSFRQVLLHNIFEASFHIHQIHM